MRIGPLNYNVNLLSKYWELNTSRVNHSAYASIDATTGKTVDAAGNATATNPMQINPNLALDINEVYRALVDPGSRANIIMLMNRPDILNLLFSLDKSKLILGLNFFSLPKLQELFTALPKELLIQALLMFMTQETLLSMMPQKELMRILGSGKIDEAMLIKALQDLPHHILIQMLEAIFGESMGKLNHAQVMKKMGHLKKRQILEGLLSLPPQMLMQLVLGFTLKDPSLLTEMSKSAICRPIMKFQKSQLIQCFSVLDKSDIIKMLGGLPKNLLAQVACMIDPATLSQILSNHFPNIVSMLGG